MSYAVFQRQLEKPPPEALERALGDLRNFVAIDAHAMSSDGYGILTSGLSYEHARILSAALAREGIASDVVDEDRIVGLPPAKRTKRVDCLREHLTVYDALDKSTHVPWPDVVLVAAGFVTLLEHERTEKTRIVMRGGGGQLPSCPIMLTDVTTREHGYSRLVLDIFLDVPPGRIEVLGHECQYNYLTVRMTTRYMDNFAILVKDLTTLAKRAVLNRGAESLRNDAGVTFHYPSRHAFEEEAIWLLWTEMGVRAADRPRPDDRETARSAS